MKLISFVIPCYRSEHTIEKVIQEIKETVAQRTNYDYEVIAVNDCSPDHVYDVLVRLSAEDPKIKVINFAKNMGKHAAVLAGYAVVKGEFIVNLDDDYQSPVNKLWQLLDLVEADQCDCATAEYYVKKENWIKRMGSNFNLLMSEMLLDKPKGLRMENLSVLKCFVAKEMIHYKHPYPYLEGLIFQVTNRVLTVKMEQRERSDDNGSGFTLKKSIALVLNGLTAFSVKPLRVASACGVAFSILGFFYGIYIIIRKLIFRNTLLGYSSIMAVMLFSSGLIMMMLGLIGEYLGRIYICINDSPQYVIKNTINIPKEDEVSL
jgi:undecaprenyl-phosphate 4-deoxy-4-formamido-L-arabinose transferase